MVRPHFIRLPRLDLRAFNGAGRMCGPVNLTPTRVGSAAVSTSPLQAERAGRSQGPAPADAGATTNVSKDALGRASAVAPHLGHEGARASAPRFAGLQRAGHRTLSQGGRTVRRHHHVIGRLRPPPGRVALPSCAPQLSPAHRESEGGGRVIRRFLSRTAYSRPVEPVLGQFCACFSHDATSSPHRQWFYCRRAEGCSPLEKGPDPRRPLARH